MAKRQGKTHGPKAFSTKPAEIDEPAADLAAGTADAGGSASGPKDRSDDADAVGAEQHADVSDGDAEGTAVAAGHAGEDAHPGDGGAAGPDSGEAAIMLVEGPETAAALAVHGGALVVDSTAAAAAEREAEAVSDGQKGEASTEDAAAGSQQDGGQPDPGDIHWPLDAGIPTDHDPDRPDDAVLHTRSPDVAGGTDTQVHTPIHGDDGAEVGGETVQAVAREWTILDRAGDAACDAAVDAAWAIAPERREIAGVVDDLRRCWRDAAAFVAANRDAPAAAIGVHLHLKKLGGSAAPSKAEAALWGVFKSTFLAVHDFLAEAEKEAEAARRNAEAKAARPTWPGKQAFQRQPGPFAATGFSPTR